MKRLLILWDPANPMAPAAPVVEALQQKPDLRVVAMTFGELGHQTLPNRAFVLASRFRGEMPDGILWIEGGPLPGDLSEFTCPKACWLLNTHHEPGLLDMVGSEFDVVYSASLRDTAEERARWLPVASQATPTLRAPQGVSVLVDDPRPAAQVEVEQILTEVLANVPTTPSPVVFALGNGGQSHPLLYDALRSGAAVVVDPDTDLRGVAHAGEHLDVYPSKEGLGDFVRMLLGDPERLARLSSRGPAIVEHLHRPDLRADRIVEGLWPRVRVLSGRDHQPRVSLLVTCYRYLRRFRVCLESLARQTLPPGSIEIVVADPASPDGLAEALGQFAERYPGLRVVHLPIDPVYHRNRGVGINRAFEASRGPVLIGIDGDLVFPPTLLATLEDCVRKNPRQVYGVRRSFIGKDDTERILRGELDPFAEFDRLSQSAGDGEEKGFVGVLGYCQAVERRAFAQARYPEEFDAVNQSDIVFVERLARWAGVSAQYLQDLAVLHLWHPRNWAGTSESL